MDDLHQGARAVGAGPLIIRGAGTQAGSGALECGSATGCRHGRALESDTVRPGKRSEAQSEVERGARFRNWRDGRRASASMLLIVPTTQPARCASLVCVMSSVLRRRRSQAPNEYELSILSLCQLTSGHSTASDVDAVDLFGDLIVVETSTTAISLCVEMTRTFAHNVLACRRAGSRQV